MKSSSFSLESTKPFDLSDGKDKSSLSEGERESDAEDKRIRRARGKKIRMEVGRKWSVSLSNSVGNPGDNEVVVDDDNSSDDSSTTNNNNGSSSSNNIGDPSTLVVSSSEKWVEYKKKLPAIDEDSKGDTVENSAKKETKTPGGETESEVGDTESVKSSQGDAASTIALTKREMKDEEKEKRPPPRKTSSGARLLACFGGYKKKM